MHRLLRIGATSLAKFTVGEGALAETPKTTIAHRAPAAAVIPSKRFVIHSPEYRISSKAEPRRSYPATILFRGRFRAEILTVDCVIEPADHHLLPSLRTPPYHF